MIVQEFEQAGCQGVAWGHDAKTVAWMVREAKRQIGTYDSQQVREGTGRTAAGDGAWVWVRPRGQVLAKPGGWFDAGPVWLVDDYRPRLPNGRFFGRRGGDWALQARPFSEFEEPESREEHQPQDETTL